MAEKNTASLEEIAYNILNTLRGGRSSHSEHLSLDQVKFAIKYYRTLFIRRDFYKNFNRYRPFEQDLGLVSLSIQDTADSSNHTSGNKLLRTDERIPAPIRMKNWEGITFVGGIDKAGKPIPVQDAHKSYWDKYNKYTDNEPSAFYRDGYVFLRNVDNADVINIRGVFEDPEDVHEFTRDNGFDLYDDNAPFPISTDMLQGITRGLIDGELRVLISTPNDTELDNLQDGNQGNRQ